VKLVWTRAAVTDRRLIRSRIAQDAPTVALAFDALIAKKAANLHNHPQLGRPGRVAGTREMVVHRNYVLVYDVTPDMVRILRVLHVARQWPPRRCS